MNDMTWLMASVLPASLMAALHWFPWPTVVGRKLRRVEAYIMGVGVFMVCATVAVWLGGVSVWWQVVLAFWLSAVSAGLATVLAYAVDTAIESVHTLRDRIDAAENND